MGMLCVCVLALSRVEAGWVKYHQVISSGGVPVAEYTHISTASGHPHVVRILYRDAVGSDIVIRRSIAADGTGPISVKVLGTPGVLRFSALASGNIQVSFQGSSFAFHENQEGSSVVRQQGQELMDGASENFMSALRRLAEVGSQKAIVVADVGRLLRAILYEDIVQGGYHGFEGEMQDVVADFDPNTTPPGSFEQAFGQAYYLAVDTGE